MTYANEDLGGEYLTGWILNGNGWLIVSEILDIYQKLKLLIEIQQKYFV
jgi:hypothetical protein